MILHCRSRKAYLNILLAKESIVYADELAKASQSQYEQGKNALHCRKYCKKRPVTIRSTGCR
jgi:hypothetical protein